MAIVNEMDQKIGSRPIVRVRIFTSKGTIDVSSYLKSGIALESEKSRLPDDIALIAAGDIELVFSNHNDYFTETDSGSLFYEAEYLGHNIDIDVGFKKDDGTTEYQDQTVFRIIEVTLNSDLSECTIIARDKLNDIVEYVLNVPPAGLTPVASSGNAGNGYITEIQTMPFVTVNETWAVTCTTLGGSGVGKFSVVGSVSGNVGEATSDTEFLNAGTGGVKFTIYAGGTAWAVPDVFTFTTYQYPEWTSESPAKIIWALLTGWGYDSGTEDNFRDSCLDFDNTATATNEDINYPSFTTAVTNLNSDFNLTGYIPYNSNMADVIQDILQHFLGYMYADGDGKVYLKTYRPSLGGIGTLREFSDAKKITDLTYKKSRESVISSATARYKKTATWAWSSGSETNDGVYTKLLDRELQETISTSADDALEDVSGVVSLTRDRTAMSNVNDGSLLYGIWDWYYGEWFGFRFPNIAIAQGSTIESATIQVWRAADPYPTSATDIYCEDVDDSAAFTTGANNISNRTRTTAKVDWDGSVGSVGYVTSPDIKTCVQEVINRASWGSGHDLSVIFQAMSNTDFFLQFTYDHSGATYAAKLNVKYKNEYGEKSFSIDTNWYSVNGNAIQWAIDRVVDKYGIPVLDVEFTTGLDALQTDLGDYIEVTDTKTGLSNKTLSVYKLSKDFGSHPMRIVVSCDEIDTLAFNWAFLGSSADEGDGISPQAGDYDSASDTDKQFCYLSDGGLGDPAYYLW